MAIASLLLGFLAGLCTAVAVVNPGGLLDAPRAPELLFMAGALLALLGLLFGVLGMKRRREAGLAGTAVNALCLGFCVTVCAVGLLKPAALSGWTALNIRVLLNPLTAPAR